MVIYILYVFIYVFFIYGVLEFLKNVYIGFNIPKKSRPIKLLIEDDRDLEFILLNIKNQFSPITLFIDHENQEIIDMIRVLENDYDIVIENIRNI